MSIDRKLQILHEMGVEFAILIDFSEQFRSYSGDEFINSIIKWLPVVHMALGKDFKCGKNLDTGAYDISEILQRNELPVDIVETLTCGEQVISSTNIRKAIKQGDIDHANHMLGRKYSVSMPKTLFSIRENNVIVRKRAFEQVVPERGVYAVEIDSSDGIIPALAAINEDTVTISMDTDNNVNIQNLIFNYREKGEEDVVN